MKNTRPDLSTRTKALYGAGGMCDSIKAITSGLYLLFFYTTVLGLPGRLVGAAAALGLIWDATIDPFIGRLSDSTSGRRFGRRHGWMLMGLAGMVMGFVGLFIPPTGISGATLFVWLLLMSLILRTGQSMFGVPYMALGAELFASYDGRTSVSGYRAAAGQLGAITASGLTLTVFFSSSDGAGSRLDANSYANMALTLGAIIWIAGAVASLGTWKHRRYVPRAGHVEKPASRLPIFRNRAFVVLTVSTALFFLASIISIVLSIYFLTYFAGIRRGTQLGLCQFALYAGGVCGVAVWARAAPAYDKHHLFFLACFLTAAVTLAAFWVAPEGGLFDAVRFPLLVAAYAAVGAAGSGVAVLAPSMLADVAEENELLAGERREGAFFGAFSAGQQVAAGLGTAIAGLLLDYFAGLVPGAVTQTASTITRLGILATIVPASLMLLAGVVILTYKLGRNQVELVQATLTAKRAGSAAEAS